MRLYYYSDPDKRELRRTIRKEIRDCTKLLAALGFNPNDCPALIEEQKADLVIEGLKRLKAGKPIRIRIEFIDTD